MKRELLAECAEALERGERRPDLAAKLRARKKPGRKPLGCASEHNEWLADIWGEISAAITAGGEESQVIANAAQRTGKSLEFLDDLWHLRGRPAVRAILIERGRIGI
jgi:hypothetical protein